MEISGERRRRIRDTLLEHRIDALFCRLSEHVLYFTGYWPRNHVGAAVVPVEGNPILILSEYEARYELPSHPPSHDVEVVTFPMESARFLRGPLDGFAETLPDIFNKIDASQGVIGVERSIEGCNIAMMQGEVKYPAAPTWKMLEDAFPEMHIVDGSAAILSLRAIKSAEEIEAIRLAVEIAGFGFSAAREAARPGMKETELASVIESAIHVQGTGYRHVTQARGYACVYTGARSARQWTHYAYSTDREIQKDDVVIIELGCFADGYWADLTRNLCVGQPTEKVREVYEIALGAQQAAIELARPGELIPNLEHAARDFMARYGYDEYWPHGLGHGVGTSYHEGPPLHAAYPRPLETGMVLTIEPGIYLEGLAGLRPEDMIVITETSPEMLSIGISRVL